MTAEELAMWAPVRVMTDLEKFETLVLSQQPATAPWTPVLPYDIETRRDVEGIQPKLIKSVFACGHQDKILDYGCGAGYLVAFLAELGLNVRGYEPAASLRERVPEYVKWLVRDTTWDYEQNSQCDVYHLVICREVLEHLTVKDIAKTVRKLCAISRRFVYVTTRFAKSPQSLLDVDTSDDLDPTHISMLNQDLLRVLFVLEGFKRRADLEVKMDWQSKGRVLVYERAA